eukprot:s592_g1.t1
MDLETLQQSVPDEHSGEEEDTESDEPLQLEEFLAERISELQPTSPDIVRATPAYQGLRRCGAALRGERQDSYHRSFETSRKASFWSHSWHGSKWRKDGSASRHELLGQLRIPSKLLGVLSGPRALLPDVSLLAASSAYLFGCALHRPD